jgi:hypothetical protein
MSFNIVETFKQLREYDRDLVIDEPLMKRVCQNIIANEAAIVSLCEFQREQLPEGKAAFFSSRRITYISTVLGHQMLIVYGRWLTSNDRRDHGSSTSKSRKWCCVDGENPFNFTNGQGLERRD